MTAVTVNETLVSRIGELPTPQLHPKFMAVSRRRSGYKYAEVVSTPFRRHPEIQHPPDDYSLIEADLHRATTSLEVHTSSRGVAATHVMCHASMLCVGQYTSTWIIGSGSISPMVCKSV